MIRTFCLILMVAALLPVSSYARRTGPGYGNYCGKGNNGGRPIDDLDRACKGHDRCLLRRGLPSSPMSLLRSSAKARKKSCPCDRKFVNDLKSVRSGGFARSFIRSYARRRMNVACSNRKRSRR